jgi:hypothetical protein
VTKVLPGGCGETLLTNISGLKTLRIEVTRALPKAANTDTRIHLDAARKQIDRVLEQKFEPVEPKQPGRSVPRSAFDEARVPISCWPEYAVGPGAQFCWS